jgi:hypothetical protein
MSIEEESITKQASQQRVQTDHNLDTMSSTGLSSDLENALLQSQSQEYEEMEGIQEQQSSDAPSAIYQTENEGFLNKIVPGQDCLQPSTWTPQQCLHERDKFIEYLITKLSPRQKKVVSEQWKSLQSNQGIYFILF